MPANYFVAVDETNKGGAVRYKHSTYSWIVDANDSYWGTSIPRFNKSFVRWPAAWKSTSITFQAQCTTLVSTDGGFAVIVDGVYYATTFVAGDLALHTVTVTGLPVDTVNGSTVEVWEPENGRTPGAQLDDGLDAPLEAGNITGVFLDTTAYVVAPGASPIVSRAGTFSTVFAPTQTFAKPTATTAIITVGDSLIGSTQPDAVTSELYRAVAGKLRIQALAKGWILASVDTGSKTLCGDGYTPAQLATVLQDVATTIGATTVYLLVAIGANDKRYYTFGASVHTTPAQFGTAIGQLVAALPASWHIVLQTTTTMAPAEEASNGAGTMQDYRDAEAAITGSNVTHLAGETIPGWNYLTDTYDGLHYTDAGVAKVVAFDKSALGL